MRAWVYLSTCDLWTTLSAATRLLANFRPIREGGIRVTVTVTGAYRGRNVEKRVRERERDETVYKIVLVQY